MSMRPIRFLAPALLLLTTAVTPSVVQAASSSVECGQVSEYTAPDPAGPTPGSLGLGLLTPWVIVPAASISTAAASALPSSAGGGPTCVALDLDDAGLVTAVDISPTGRISGPVSFDAVSDWYLFADRLVLPTFIADQTPGLAAIFAPSAAAQTPLTVDFSVDTTSGAFVGFDGLAAFCGAGSLGADNEGLVGAATLPAAVLDAEHRAALTAADGQDVCATVRSVGSIDPSTGEITVDTTVTIEPAGSPAPSSTGTGRTVTPPPTSTLSQPGAGRVHGSPWAPILLTAAGGALALAQLARASYRRRS